MKQNETKRCPGCKQGLPISAFARNKSKATGLQSSCRECRAAAQRKYNTSPKGKAASAQYHKAWYLANRERLRALGATYRRTAAGKATRDRAWQKAKGQPERRQQRCAKEAVQRAVRIGRLTRPSACEQCGAPAPLQAHHYLGYAHEHWLDVQWLCVQCHTAAHAKDAIQAAC